MWVDYFTPIGTSLAEADRLGQELDQILSADPDVLTFTRRLGAELGPPRATRDQPRRHHGAPSRPNHRPIEELMLDQRRLFRGQACQAFRVELIQLLSDMLGDLEGNPEPIELKLFGPDEAELRKQAARIAAEIKDVEGLADLFDGQVGVLTPNGIVQLDALKLGRMGADQRRRHGAALGRASWA